MASFGKKELDEIAKKLAEQAELQEKLNNSVSAYAAALKKVAELQANIKHIEEQKAILIENEKKNQSELTKLKAKLLTATKAEKKVIKEQIDDLKKKILLQKTGISYAEEALKLEREKKDQLVESLGNVNKLNMALKASNQALSAVPGLIKKGFGILKSTGLFDMDKSIRMAALEMGKVESSSTSFGKSIGNAADSTTMMGVNIKELSKMQANYSTQLGRSVMLSEDGMIAMGELAAGTMLGVDGASSLVAEMDRFNISVEGTRDMIEETVNMSEKMGINSTKVLKTLENSLKMANKYHFKGGVEGMVKMAAQAAKFNMSMETTAGLADKLFDIEGAVEMSAQLNTMGGEWARLGDPMKLMYQARNDMEGLQTSIIDATAGMADFNKTTGEFEFSGLELHRMRELEKITGISAEEMANMAKSKAKFEKISGELGFSVAGDPEMKEFIENTAVFNKDTKQFEIKLSGSEKAIPVKELTASHKQMMIADAKSLKERAEASQTFDDTLNNTIDLFKQALLPVLDGLNKQLPAIQGMIKSLKDNGWIDKLKTFAKTVGDIAGKVLGLMIEWPKTTLALLVGAKIFGPLIQWYANGKALGAGFNSVAGGMGGAGGGGGSLGSSKGLLGKTARNTMKGGGLSGKMGGFGRGMAGKGMGIGALGMIGGMALDYGRGMLDDQNSVGGKAMGVAGGALSGAGTGAMIGSVIPIVGTAAGAIIGGLIGGIYSAVEEFGGDGGGVQQGVSQLHDGVMMDGKITAFDKKDDVLKFQKKGGAIDKAIATGGAISGGGGGTTNIHISFDELKVTSDGSSGKIDLSTDSAFIRELATKIKESLSQTANGGVLNPNPST